MDKASAMTMLRLVAVTAAAMFVVAGCGTLRMDDNAQDEEEAAGALEARDLSPLVKGYYDGGEVFFIHTEVSDEQVAARLTRMPGPRPKRTGPRVPWVPELAEAPEALVEDVYIFQNGIEGTGPFQHQPDVFTSVPGDEAYSPLRSIHLVNWADEATPRVLRSAEEVQKAQAQGEITVEESGIVVNMPIMAWPGGHR